MRSTCGFFERAVLDHEAVAAAPLFARLKTEDERTRDLGAQLAEPARRAKQDRDMPVVTARVHDARDLRFVRRVDELRDRQRVHVGAQQRHGPRTAAL